VCAMGICSKGSAGASIVICTDGLSNIGLGSLDELFTEQEKDQASQFYQQLGLFAKNKGITISVISIKGTDCSIENLGSLADITSGVVDRVDPLNLSTNFQSILSSPPIAVSVSVSMHLHKGLYIRQEESEAENKQDSYATRDIGNVSKETNVTFEYGVRSDYKKEEFNALKELPFQLQIKYTKLDGMKCMRVISKTQPITFDKKVAEENANVAILGVHTIQNAAKLAAKGEYSKARFYNKSNKVMMDRVAKTEQQMKHVSAWSSHARAFEDEMSSVQRKQLDEGIDSDEEDAEMDAMNDEKKEENDEKKEEKEEKKKEMEAVKKALKEKTEKARKNARTDTTSNMLYNMKSIGYSKMG